MPKRPAMEFGYSVPTSEGNRAHFSHRDFLQDIYRALDTASQGFHSVWVSDHLAFGSMYLLECWTLLAWVASRYPGVRLGTSVLCNSFRHPSLMAKMAASLQEISSGRLIFGYGAGWHEDEYNQYGFAFPPPRTRIEMMEEAVELIRALWTNAPANFSGKHYRVVNAHCEPRPDPPPPIMIGGTGEKYTLRVVARHADWWNISGPSLENARRKLDVLRGHCEAEGRDYLSIRKTFTATIHIDRSHAAALEAAGNSLRDPSPPIAGDPSAVREQLGRFAALGFDLCSVSFPRFPDLDDMRLFMDEVAPHFS